MTSLRKLFFNVPVSFVFGFFLIVPVFARVDAVAQNINEERQQLREEIRENRCEIISNRIDARIQLFEQNREFHENIYDALVEKTQRLVNWVKEKDLDTSKLEADLKVLNDKITDAWEDYSLFISLLRESKDFTCGESQGQFKEKLQEALDQLKVFKEDLQDIRNYYKNTIKEDMKDLRDQYNQSKDNK